MEEAARGVEASLPKYPHVFQAKTPNSERLRDTVAAANATVAKGRMSKKAYKRLKKKEERMRELTVHALPATGILQWDGSSLVYMRGGPASVLEHHLKEGHRVIDATSAPMVLHSERGGVVKDVCCLLPSEETIGLFTSRSGDAFEALETVTKKSKARGQNRCPAGMEKYMIMGVKACRNKHGLMDGISTLRDLPAAHKEFSRILRTIEHRVVRWIDTIDLKFLSESKRISGYTGFQFYGGQSSKIWPSLACARNTYLPLHTDEDYFLGAVSVYCRAKTKNIVLQYFCFPTLGISVAMKNGDLLLFNPRVPHCISSPTSCIQDSFSLSAYLKSIIVSGNSNLPITTCPEG